MTKQRKSKRGGIDNTIRTKLFALLIVLLGLIVAGMWQSVNIYSASFRLPNSGVGK